MSTCTAKFFSIWTVFLYPKTNLQVLSQSYVQLHYWHFKPFHCLKSLSLIGTFVVKWPGESSSQKMQFIAYNTPVDNLGNCLLYAVLNKYTIYLCKSRFAFLDGVGMVYVFLRHWLFTCRCFSFNYIDCLLFSSYLTHVTPLQDSTNEMGWRVWCHARKKNYTVWIMEVYGW